MTFFFQIFCFETAIGCPEMSAPLGGWVKQNNQVALIGCTLRGGSGEAVAEEAENQWQLQCQGTNWVGEMKNCTAGM